MTSKAALIAFFVTFGLFFVFAALVLHRLNRRRADALAHAMEAAGQRTNALWAGRSRLPHPPTTTG